MAPWLIAAVRSAAIDVDVWLLMSWIGASSVPFFFLLFLCSIEHVGIRFWGNRRGSRITRPVAEAVIGHASYGWVLGGLVGCAAAPGLHALVDAWRDFTVTRGPWGWLLVSLPWTTGPIVGLLAFEWLAFRGAIACRFANPPDASLRARDDGRSSRTAARP